MNSDYCWPPRPYNGQAVNGMETFRAEINGNGGTPVPSYDPELLAGLLLS